MLFNKYAGTSKGKVLCPFHKEKTPSLLVDNNRFRCFGCGENGNIWQFVKLLYKVNYGQAVDLIYSQLNITIVNKTIVPIYEESDNNIEYKISEWQSKHIDYWAKYNINKHILNMYDVYPIRLIYKGNNVIFRDYKDNLAFIYFFSKGWKIYLPYCKPKFLSKGCNIQGLQGLDFTNPKLIITKSLKDVMFLKSIGYNSIAPASEMIHIREQTVRYLLNRFDMYVNFDNDGPGMKGAVHYTDKYNINSIVSPYTKDFTDMVIDYGLEQTTNKLKELI